MAAQSRTDPPNQRTASHGGGAARFTSDREDCPSPCPSPCPTVYAPRAWHEQRGSWTRSIAGLDLPVWFLAGHDHPAHHPGCARDGHRAGHDLAIWRLRPQAERGR